MAELYEDEIPDFDEKEVDYDSEIYSPSSSEAEMNSEDESSVTKENNDNEEDNTEKYFKTDVVKAQTTKKMEATCKYCKIELNFPRFNPISSKRHIQQCQKYHSFITDGHNCIFCKKSQKSIGHLFNHLGSKHSKEMSNLQNSVSPSKISNTTKIENKIKKRCRKLTVMPSTKSCALCDFETNKESNNRFHEMEKHYSKKHFQDRILNEIIPLLPKIQPFKCPAPDCNFVATTKNIAQGPFQIKLHYLRKHGILTKYIDEALNKDQYVDQDSSEIEHNTLKNETLALVHKSTNAGSKMDHASFNQKSRSISGSTKPPSWLPNVSECVLCGDKPSSNSMNPHQILFHHYCQKHFVDKINSEIKPLISKENPLDCPDPECNYICNPKRKSNRKFQILQHYLRKHGILKKFIDEALLEKQKMDKAGNEIKEKDEISENIKISAKKGRPSLCHLPSTDKCQLCAFVNKATKNKHQEMFKHYLQDHFQDKIAKEITTILPTKKPFECPFKMCNYKKTEFCNRDQTLNHVLKNHGFMEKYIKDEEEKKRGYEKIFSKIKKTYQHIADDEMPNPELNFNENVTKKTQTPKKRSRSESTTTPLEQNPKKKLKRKKELDSLPDFEQGPSMERSRCSSSNNSLTSKEYPDSGIDDTESINSDQKVHNVEDIQQIWNMEGDQTLVVGGRHIEKSRIRECSIILERCDQKEQIIPKQEGNIGINNDAMKRAFDIPNISFDHEEEKWNRCGEKSLAVENDDIEEVPKIQQTNKKSVQEKTAIKITICDKEPKMSLTAKISKPSSQITLADIKNLILQRWQNFGKRTSPRVEDYTYSAKTIEDGEIEMQVIDEDSDDNDIVPSFHNGKEIKIEIICAL